MIEVPLVPEMSNEPSLTTLELEMEPVVLVSRRAAPELIVVVPLYLLVLVKVSAPASTVTPPAPLMTPLKVVAPAFDRMTELPPSLTVPEPPRALIVTSFLAPLISNAPLSVTFDDEAMLPVPVIDSVAPVLIVVAPV